MLGAVTSVGHHVQQSRATARRLAHDGDAILVAAKTMDVLLDPLESHALIEQSSIEVSLTFDFKPRQPAKGAEAIVNSHVDHTLRILISLGE